MTTESHNQEVLDHHNTNVAEIHEYSIRIKRLFVIFALVAWCVLMGFVAVVGSVASDAKEAATKAKNLGVENRCQRAALADLDTKWRIALDNSLLAQYRGEDPRPHIEDFDKVAKIDVAEYLKKRCSS